MLDEYWCRPPKRYLSGDDPRRPESLKTPLSPSSSSSSLTERESEAVVDSDSCPSLSYDVGSPPCRRSANSRRCRPGDDNDEDDPAAAALLWIRVGDIGLLLPRSVGSSQCPPFLHLPCTKTNRRAKNVNECAIHIKKRKSEKW